MARIFETGNRAFVVACTCGQEISGEIYITGLKIKQAQLEKITLDMSGASAIVCYGNGMVNCPGCGKELPTEAKEQ